MESNIKRMLIASVIIVFALSVYGQDKTLVGKVTTFDSIPLVGVDIEIKSTGRIVQTDELGRFQLFCNSKDKLNFSADGFYPKKVTVKDDIRMIFLNMNLKNSKNNLELAERYINVGYGYVSSKDLQYAVSHANRDDINFSNYDTVLDAIQGEFPGVHVENGVIIVRGYKTFKSGGITAPVVGSGATVVSVNGTNSNYSGYANKNSAATVVIDGMISNYSDLANVSPLDVKSVDVLKDGSSSVYGSRSANGVVIIETIKGGNK